MLVDTKNVSDFNQSITSVRFVVIAIKKNFFFNLKLFLNMVDDNLYYYIQTGHKLNFFFL